MASRIEFNKPVLVGDVRVDHVSVERGKYEVVHGMVRFDSWNTDAGSTVDARVMVPYSNVLFISTIDDLAL